MAVSRPLLLVFSPFFRCSLRLGARNPESGTKGPGGGSVTVQNGRQKSGRRRSLKGESSVVNGVSIWRPLLPFTKEQIYDFAHRYGVPYFKDTTPHWSTRGHLRNELVPLLSSTYPSTFAQTQLETQVCATCNLCNRSTSNR